jgi:hypothetical protein
MMFDQITDLLFWALASGGCLLGFCKQGGNSSPPPYPVEKIKKMMDEYIRDTKRDIKPLLKKVAQEGANVTKKIDNLVAKGERKLNNEEEQLLSRLRRAENKLTKFQETEDASLLSDLETINEDLQKSMNLLDEKDRTAFQKELSSFESDAAKLVEDYDTRSTAETERGFQDSKQTLDDYEAKRLADIAETEKQEFATTDQYSADTASLAEQYRKESEALSNIFRADSAAETDRREKESKDATGRFDTETKALADEYRKDTTGFADKFASDSKSLGDTYLSMANQSTSEYQSILDQARDLSPERLNIFTQAADYLSNAAVQTRMNLLATADPRALELSQIADNNAAAMMSGQISADVQANLARSSAMRALGGGFGAGSQMGRGLAARDLGLTSLDLMRQGAELNDAQRRLNYATRVEGTQVDAGGLLANDQNLMRQGAADMLTAQTNRNQTFYDVGQRALAGELEARNVAATNFLDQSRTSLTERQRAELDQLNKIGDTRQNAFLNLFTAGRQDAQGIYDKTQASRDLVLGSNLATIRYGAERTDNTFNTVLAGNLANVDTRTQQNLATAANVLNSGMDTNRVGFAAELGNRESRTTRQANTLTNTWDRDFQNRVGMYNTNIGTGRSIYSTNVNAAGNLFTTGANAIYQNTGMRAGIRENVYNTDVGTRMAGFQALTNVRGQAAATNVDALSKSWAADNARYSSNVSNNNAMWGNILQTGASIAGAAIGTAAGNPMAGYQIGSTVGSIGNQAVSGQSGGGGGGGGFGSMFNFVGALGGRNTSGLDSQWGMYGKSAPGFGNFDDFGNV